MVAAMITEELDKIRGLLGDAFKRAATMRARDFRCAGR